LEEEVRGGIDESGVEVAGYVVGLEGAAGGGWIVLRRRVARGLTLRRLT
jgi:hypothetical protein